MKALLTGITGNLGYEISRDLTERGTDVVPCVRPGSIADLRNLGMNFSEVIECDFDEAGINYKGEIDSIVHSAGVVHFRDAGNKNEAMMRRVITLAKELSVPVYFVSTAFIYRPDGSTEFNNAYEKDKSNAERLLLESGLEYCIFRPSVLTGHSKTGSVRNFSGYYLVARAFVLAAQSAKARDRSLRFPRMRGESNIIPVDQVAKAIGEAVVSGARGTFYLTNTSAPQSEWVLKETLKFFGFQDDVIIEDVPFQDFVNLDLTPEEAALYTFSKHFSPYWSIEYSFPASICTENRIDHEYMKRALTFFRDSDNFHGKRNH